MAVVSGKVIFCEGKETSLDYKLLGRIVENISSELLTIVPAGSKFGFSNFIQGYFNENDLKISQKLKILQIGLKRVQKS